MAATRRSWGPSGSHPWLLGGSEDPGLSVPDFGQVWRFFFFIIGLSIGSNMYKRELGISNNNYQ